jgi:hypothetical protein
MKLAVHIGGRSAAEMLRRQNLAGLPAVAVEMSSGTIAGTTNILRRQDGNIFATVGTPIRSVDPSRIVDVRSAEENLPSQDGAFVSIYWNEAERKLVVVTDFLGLKPFYLIKRPGELLLASETKAWQASPDPAGWGAFISFGHTIGDRTLLCDVERVHPGTILVYDASSDSLRERCYWHWPKPKPGADLEGLVDTLEDSVREYAKYGEPGELLLSGGFDSRLILCLLKAADIPASALTVEHPEELMDADGRFASAIARRLNCPLRRVRSSRNFFSSSAYIDYLIANDAATPSLYLFISQLAQFIRLPSVWEGVILGYTMPTPHQSAGGFDSYLRQECGSSNSTAWNNAREIFSRQFCDMMLEGFQADLRQEIARYSDDGYGVTEFVIRNRSRNRTATNPLKVYEGRTRVFLPGMTRDFFDIVGSISFDIRRNSAMYLELLQRFFPAALSVPIVSGGVLFRPSVWSGSYYGNKAIAAIRRFVVNYPNVFRRFGYDPTAAAFKPSRFLDLTLLLDDDDPYIDSDRVRELAREGILSQNAYKLLFHWRAWHWVHRGTLKERLSPWI